jgi:hypothetical protein
VISPLLAATEGMIGRTPFTVATAGLLGWIATVTRIREVFRFVLSLVQQISFDLER